ncbi:probable LRR receptor-like serine/threonine-protein kinase At1g07650 isoform X2 [Andrographis paniculata]|nr:probable LRR receptor-like serine/threonine-protein kinase At1g07650 isoform X2 [Andrographis paniculata]
MYNTTIVCNCSIPNGTYYIQSINFKGQDLPGVLPPSLSKLRQLEGIDLNRNFLSGTIPPEWASTKLKSISVSVNRLSGPIPRYLGNITTLTYLSLETNLFSGSVPPELGNLVNLERLVLSANFLTGKLPVELAKLKNLIEFRISSNNFAGKLPDFLNWTNLQYLEIEAGGFSGPIPPTISNLINLTELKISHLSGGASKFPRLERLSNLTKLMLQSCNIFGNIPPFGDLSRLKILDLSFNNLEGPIPNLEGLGQLEIVFLTGNSLSGSIPEWIIKRDPKQQIDLSYNNFNEDTMPQECRDNSLNLYRSYQGRNALEFVKCLSPCPKDWYSFHVNCGGNTTRINGTTFDDDKEPLGPVKFVHLKEQWGISITGDFWYRPDRRPEYYLPSNVSALRMKDSELYETARQFPLSATYYGRCLANGNYTVTLHFAEIVFQENQSYWSLGRRIFDVYIQGKLKLKDFDIKHDAGGAGIAVLKTFKNVPVMNNSLEIRFHYTGKGTTAIPTRGVYGPLVSAISVKSEFKPPLSRRAKIFIALGASLFALLLIVVALLFSWWKGYIGGRISREEALRGLNLHTGFFTFKQIQAATENFNAANKLGEGGFGAVYKGTLLDGTLIAVKQLSSKSRQGNREFVNEIGVISGLQHPNLVKLYGCCVEGSHLLLVYEFMENNSLARALFGPEEHQLEIDWPTRGKICLGIANGLVYLHEESALKIVHRDIKANNILLDKDLNPKISDFGLAKLDEEEHTHITTRVAGTIGYMAPEYALWGYLTYKADVFSFGVVILEIVAGKNNMRYRPNENCVCLLDWALILQKQRRLMELVDPRLGSEFDRNEAEKIIRIALLCTSPSPALRPTMSEVVGMLQGQISIQEFNMDPDVYDSELKLQALREKYEDSYVDSSSTHGGTTSSSMSKDSSAIRRRT